MQSDNKFFDDLAKLGQSAFGTLHGVKAEIEAIVRARLEHVLVDMDLVTREEFDVVRDMAREAREKNEALEQKIAKLEKSLSAQKDRAKKSTSAKKTTRSTKAESDKETK